MTQPIELVPNVRVDELMTPLSRYLTRNLIYYGEQKFMTFDSYIRQEFIPTGNEKTMLVTKGVEYRPDLVASDIFGVPDVWWRILEVNGMKDVWEFKAGVTIILPTDVV